jgi:hypothetical protein
MPVKRSAKKTAPARKITAVKKPMTKSAIIGEIALNTELNKKQVSSVLDELANPHRASYQETLSG